MIMKHLALTLALIIGVCFSGLGQEIKHNPNKQDPEQKAETETAKATKKLTLNDKQKAVYKQFVLQRIAANKPIRQKLKTTTDANTQATLKKELDTNRDKFRANVNAMLNPEQQTKWTEMNMRQDKRANTTK